MAGSRERALVEDPDKHSDVARHADDLKLVERARARDPLAMDQLAVRLQRVLAFLRAINRRRGSALSDHDLEDLSQDVTIRILAKLEAYHGRGALDNWLYRFCLLEFMNRLRSKSRAPVQEALNADPASPQRDGAVDLDEFAAQLARLPQDEAAIVDLRTFDRLGFEQIAARLGIPKGTAKSRYYTAIERLRGYMRGLLPEEPA